MTVYFKCTRNHLRDALNLIRGSISHKKVMGLTLPLTIHFKPKSISLTTVHQTEMIEAICDKEIKVTMPFRVLWKALAEHSTVNFTGVIKEGQIKIGSYEAKDEQICFIKG